MSVGNRLKGLLRGEYSSLSVTFNDHSPNYMNAKEAVESGYLDFADWVSNEEKEKAIANNSVWVLHWYPDTTVEFIALAASTLEACMVVAKC